MHGTEACEQHMIVRSGKRPFEVDQIDLQNVKTGSTRAHSHEITSRITNHDNHRIKMWIAQQKGPLGSVKLHSCIKPQTRSSRGTALPAYYLAKCENVRVVVLNHVQVRPVKRSFVDNGTATENYYHSFLIVNKS
ncbi:hypothetical protein FVEG_14701 [Fusarium verticillioides 7600]|uniref:Uncharacterized protein n=1 Tax=Gibberella moniliformis (strain M3125 / FGSC 7600) TaxID=334819 RepID=W7LDR1_GIBM7|nr:hypothetical protein FVEG_14701 [Fusarium verticillioides 7600]XP_018742900.1 hypothetical protein FVEG_14701 [Fusarium verticillioides 7600]XP_018742901.1 hypothetical protein FVEG_14701 [Fusarium verticillioides 7600]XP_018742902.1 hypothetical protein FVEG_14701 [Fusarium verticillioides 7600]EWG36708.1 hypothetical protein FVEG_14701 [Fusarium verticillioides 7600]EWG36709.1 hypothetical protein FVEG_14701 [Fusarium verticillioides 7600]EWG36710.1 hypothetical protein FVEG_14701 [Fusar